MKNPKEYILFICTLVFLHKYNLNNGHFCELGVNGLVTIFFMQWYFFKYAINSKKITKIVWLIFNYV